jgi:hypothetical protein
MNKAMLAWLATIWTIFGAWLFTAIPFPLNIGLLAWLSFFGLVISWLMLIEDKSKR